MGDENPIANEKPVSNGAGGSEPNVSIPQGGSDGQGRGTSVGGSAQGGSGGSDVGGSDNPAGAAGAGGAGGSEDNQGGSDDQGQGGSDIEQGGAGGVAGSENQGGSDQGQGGSDQGGSAGLGGSSSQGGSEQNQGGSDQGGAGGSDIEPTPECDWEGYRCTGALLESCVRNAMEFTVEYKMEFVVECGVTPETQGPNCDEGIGCYGECLNGEVRCSAGGDAQACLEGAWTTTEVCAFQCTNAACEGECEPGTTRCVGTSTQTCRNDFTWQTATACPTAANATTTCSGPGVCGLTPIACSSGTADCDGNWSCETNLSNVNSCGGCGVVCPSAANATRTCTGAVCGLTPIPCSSGTADCDGNWSCETPTSNDPLNCGGCGLSCYGGACNAGQCDYDFEVVSDFSGSRNLNDEVVDLTVDSTHVYWLTQTELRRALKDGSAPFETLAAIQPMFVNEKGLILDGGMLYWLDTKGIFKMPASGGTPVQLTDTTGTKPLPRMTTARSLVLSAGKLYWNDSPVVRGYELCPVPLYNGVSDASAQLCNQSKVTRFYTLTIATGAVTSWTTTQYEFSPVLGVVGNELFVVRFEYNSSIDIHQGRVLTLNAATGAFSRGIAGGLSSTFGTAVFVADKMVYTALLSNYAYGLGVAPLAPADANHNTFLTDNVYVEHGVGLAATSTHAYNSTYGGVYRVALNGTGSEHLFGSATAIKIALDNNYVYWSVRRDTGEKAILRTVK